MLEALGLDPRLPAAWQAVELRLRYHGRRLRLRTGHDRLELATDGPVPVLDTAVVLGRRLRLPVVALHVRQDGVEPERLLAARTAVELRLAVGVPAQAIVGALGGTDVARAVLGVRGHPTGPARRARPPQPWPTTLPSPWWWCRRHRTTHHRPGCTGSWCHWTAPRTRPGPWSRPCAGSPAQASRS